MYGFQLEKEAVLPHPIKQILINMMFLKARVKPLFIKQYQNLIHSYIDSFLSLVKVSHNFLQISSLRPQINQFFKFLNKILLFFDLS